MISHVLAAAFFGGADIDQLHAVGFRGEFVPVGVELGVARHLIIVADVEAERFLGGGDFGGRLRGEGPGGEDRTGPPTRGGASFVKSWVRVYYCLRATWE